LKIWLFINLLESTARDENKLLKTPFKFCFWNPYLNIIKTYIYSQYLLEFNLLFKICLCLYDMQRTSRKQKKRDDIDQLFKINLANYILENKFTQAAIYKPLSTKQSVA
jgi:hypothetical protein